MGTKYLAVGSIFLLETLLQIAYYSVKIKYFETFQAQNSLRGIVIDTVYAVGTLKCLIFLPVYLALYLSNAISKIKSIHKRAIIHAGIFLFVFLVLRTMLPGGLSGQLIDVISLSCFAFVSAYAVMKLADGLILK